MWRQCCAACGRQRQGEGQRQLRGQQWATQTQKVASGGNNGSSSRISSTKEATVAEMAAAAAATEAAAAMEMGQARSCG
jgi:hypothetical protein